MTSVLIIAQSARALAQSAVKAGWKAYAIDQFGDLDTRAATQHCDVVCNFSDTPTLLVVVELLLDKHHPSACVIGGGMESALESLMAVNERLPFTGNSLEIYRRLCDPISFCKLLDNLGITYPETVSDGSAASTSGWLAKRVGGSGGGHIRPLAAGELPGDGYYRQRRVDGMSASVLFLANGRNAQVLGYTRHWQAQPDAGRSYCRSGLIRWSAVPAPTRAQLENTVSELTLAAGLRGLCGLDFMLGDDGSIAVLEINPRPPASFELHEGEASLLGAHRRACDGELISPPPAPASAVKASVALYATCSLTVPAGFVWPRWCADIPAAGTVIERDQPVCTVMALATSMEATQALAEKRLLTLLAELKNFQSIT
ncbi:MAG TPA: ATP-grasp domain-containing protein [Gammaproteobacteria bacterium]|nr:ATP-grasp domain-containing protein [Gammaproteobacteria bacterium]